MEIALHWEQAGTVHGANREGATKGTQKHSKKRNEIIIEGKKIFSDVAKSFQTDHIVLYVHIKSLTFCKQASFKKPYT